SMDALFDKTRLDAAVAVETPFAAVACELVAAGVGVALVDPVTAHFYRNRVGVRPIEPSFSFCFEALTLTGHPRSSAVNRLLGLVDDEIARLRMPRVSMHSASLPR